MKVEILSFSDSKKCNFGSSFIVNDKILINIPTTLGKNSIENFNTLLISEFNHEYVSGIARFFDIISKNHSSAKLTVVAPKDFLRNFLQYCSVYNIKLTPQQVESVLNIVEVNEITSLSINNLSLHALPSPDGRKLFFAFVDEAKNIVGILCGDSSEDEIESRLKDCDRLFIGGSNPISDNIKSKNLFTEPGIYRI